MLDLLSESDEGLRVIVSALADMPGRHFDGPEGV